MKRGGALAVQATLVYAGLAAGLSQYNVLHNSDTVLQTLISTVHWTPFYWAENRFGMLVPLLASPIKDALANLFFQTVLVSWAAFLAVWLTQRFTEDDLGAALSTAFAVPVMLLLLKQVAGLVILLQSTYVTPLALILGGWHLCTTTRLFFLARVLLFAIALALSFWINAANIVLAVVMVCLWPGLRVMERALLGALPAVVGAGALAVASRYPGADRTQLLPAGEWLPGLGRVLLHADEKLVQGPIVLALLLIGAVLLWRRRRWDRRAALALAACAQIAAVAPLEWVHRNGSDSRYIVPALFLLVTLAASALAQPLAAGARRLQSAGMAYTMAVLALVAVATRAFGVPSAAAARAYLEQPMAKASRSFPESGCTHLIGDYWLVWAAVFHDRLAGRVPPRHAVTARSEAVRHVWDRDAPATRMYCGECDDPEVEAIRVHLGLPPLVPAAREGKACRWITP